MKTRAAPVITPVNEASLIEFCEFLHAHLNSQIPVTAWESALRPDWSSDSPNFGFILRDLDGRIVGGIGAIYADRVVRGEVTRFCNITSWCVLPAYRRYGMKLAIALLSQPGYHFTVLSPTEIVAKSLQAFGFIAMDDSALVIPSLPGWQTGVQSIEGLDAIERALEPDAAKVFRDHRRCSWISHVAVGKPGAYCHFAHMPATVQRLPCADVIFISDPELFLRYRSTIGRVLLLRHGIVAMRIESRLLPRRPWLSKHVPGYYRKIFRSDRLAEADVSNFYSEIVSLRM